MRVLEIGPGTVDGKSIVFPDADTVCIKGSNPTANVELGQSPLPFADGSYDLVFASHILEHIPWYRTAAALQEIYRVLKPGGEFEVYVPDFAFIVQCYLKQRCGDNWRIFNEAGNWMTWVNGRLFTYGEDATELLSKIRPIPQTHHKAVFDEPYLLAHLKAAGFKQLQTLSERRNGKAHGVREAGALGIKS